MGNLGDIGTAVVTVELDFSRAMQEARTQGREIQMDPVDVKVKVDREQASHELKSTLKTITPDAREADVKVKFEEQQARKAIRDTLVKAAKAAEPDTRPAFKRLGGSTAANFARGFFGRLKALQFGSRFLAVIKPVAILAAFGVITQAISATTAAVITLGGALAPLAGGLVALPGILGSVYQAMGVVKLATAGVTDALGGLTDKVDPKKLKALTPAAQSFVLVLDSMKPKILSLQKALQSAAFPGFTKAVKELQPLFTALRPSLIETAAIMGHLADRVAQVAVSMKGDLAKIARANNDTIRDLGAAGLEITKSLVDVLVVARPLMRFMTTSLKRFAGGIAKATGAARANGGMAAFFERTQVAMTSVTKLVGTLGHIIGSIFKASFPFGMHLLDILNQNATALSNFLAGAKGQRTLTKFFADAQPAIMEVGRLIRDVVGAFFALGKTKGLAGILKTVRTQLLPVIVNLVKTTTTQFLPVLLPAIVNLVKLFSNFAGTTGALTNITKLIGTLAGNLNLLLIQHPGLLNVLNDLSTLAALGVTFGLLGTAITGLTTIFKGLVFIVESFVAVFGGIEVAVGVTAIAFEIIGVKFWTAFGGMVKAQYDLFIATYRTSAAFKFFGAIISAWSIGIRIALNDVRSGFDSWKLGVKVALAAVASAFSWLRTQIANWWTGVKVIWSTAIASIMGWGGAIRSALSGINLYSIGTSIMGTLERGLKAGFEAIKSFILTIPNWIKAHKGPLSVDKKLLYPAGIAIMHGFDRGLHQKYAGVQNWVKNIGGFFQGAFNPSNLDIAGVMLGTANLDKLSGALGNAFNIPLDQLKNGPGGFLHATSGWADTLSQVKLLEHMFPIGMTSGLRSVDTVAGPRVSQHVLGQAADFGDSRASHATLTRLAEFASRLHRVFKQVIWQNHLWADGKATGAFVPKHMDHVHLGWQARAAGGQVSKGRPYQWNERGQETLVPHQNGYVMNAGRTKELVGAIRALAQRPAGGGNQSNVEMHVHSNAADPRAVASMTMASLGGVFSRA